MKTSHLAILLFFSAVLALIGACGLPAPAEIPSWLWDNREPALDFLAKMIATASAVLLFIMKVGLPLAQKTQTKLDDRALGWASKAAGWLASALSAIAWIAAKLSLNLPHLPKSPPAAPSDTEAAGDGLIEPDFK